MSQRRKARPASRWVGFLGVALAAAPAAALAQPQDLFLERTAMSAAAERCDLFTPEISSALAASALQARGAALRAGADARTLQAQAAEARSYVAGLDCRSPQVTNAAAKVQSAFSGYARITRVTYPGDVADWRADRSITRAARWRLAQSAKVASGRVTFGLAGQQAPGVLLAVAEFPAGSTPYSARLLLRDSARTLGPYLINNRAGAALTGRLPPRAALKAYLAEARALATPELLPRDAKAGGWAFRFPAQATAALGGLDPREAVAVEFLFPGERTVTAYVEVGDFAAGQAFLKLAAR